MAGPLYLVALHDRMNPWLTNFFKSTESTTAEGSNIYGRKLLTSPLH